MSISVAQKIGFGLSANLIPDPGNAGSIRVGDAGISVCNLTVAANARVLEDGGYAGQLLVLVNDSGGAITQITDSATAVSLTLDATEAALCVYTGKSVNPWNVVIVKTGAVT